VFSDFFDHQVAEKKPNTQNWPKSPHHKMEEKPNKHLCARYQSTGKCPSLHWYMAHVDPTKMGNTERQSVADRFKEIFR
jgi:hypothetical protein